MSTPAYQWWCEYSDAYFSSGTESSPGAANAKYAQCRDGAFKVGPNGEAARCGWYTDENASGYFPSDDSYRSSTCPQPQKQSSSSASGWSLTKVIGWSILGVVVYSFIRSKS